MYVSKKCRLRSVGNSLLVAIQNAHLFMSNLLIAGPKDNVSNININWHLYAPHHLKHFKVSEGRCANTTVPISENAFASSHTLLLLGSSTALTCDQSSKLELKVKGRRGRGQAADQDGRAALKLCQSISAQWRYPHILRQ